MKRIMLLLICMAATIVTLAQQKNNRFYYAGFDSDSEFITFYCHFQEAVVQKDTNYISEILFYPLVVYDSSYKKTMIKNAVDFFHCYRRIFSKTLIDVLVNQKVDDFIVNNSYIGTIHGEVWFAYLQRSSDKIPKVYITTINNIANNGK